ncbi:MAG: CDP-archaeol synthase [Candidatus Parcubacteria bacterium]|nr:CDP-archaeol synthase [Candidatus Parcubacteria bacterium]
MIILQALYFMLPGYCANMAPVFAAKIFGEFFSYPLDFGWKMNNKPVLGKNKTWRGLIAAILVGILIVTLQSCLYPFIFFKNLSILDYTQINVWLFGLLFGLGVILADAIKSFFKRRKNLKPGDKWFPWDQLDFVGALILISLVYLPLLEIIIIISFISPLLPIAANWIGYKLKLKKVAW